MLYHAPIWVVSGVAPRLELNYGLSLAKRGIDPIPITCGCPVFGVKMKHQSA